MEIQVKCRSLVNVALSSAALGMTIDGLKINAFDVVLLPGQTNTDEATIYQLTFDGKLQRYAASVDAGTLAVVMQGTGNGITYRFDPSGAWIDAGGGNTDAQSVLTADFVAIAPVSSLSNLPPSTFDGTPGAGDVVLLPIDGTYVGRFQAALHAGGPNYDLTRIYPTADAQCGKLIVLVTNGINGDSLYSQKGMTLAALAYTKLTNATSPVITYDLIALYNSTTRTNFNSSLLGHTALTFTKGTDSNTSIKLELSGSATGGNFSGSLIADFPYYQQYSAAGTLTPSAVDVSGVCGNCSMHLVGTMTAGAIASGTITLTRGSVSEVLTWQSNTTGAVSLGAAVYIDPTNGSDANNGTSAATPKQTLPAPADSGVYRIACGTKVQGGLADQTKTFTVHPYGVGPDPILDCTNWIESVGTVTKTAGKTNIYQFTLPVVVPNGGAGNAKVTALGRQMLRISNATPSTALTTMDGTSSECYYAADFSSSDSTVTVYVRNAAGTAPVANRYRVDVLESAIYCRGSSDIRGIVAAGGQSNNGSIVIRDKDASDSPKRYGCRMIGGGKHNGLICGGDSKDNIFLYLNRINGAGDGSHDVFFRTTGNSLTYTSTNDAVIGDKNNPNTDFQIGHLVYHCTSGTLGAVTVSNAGVGYVSGSISFDGGSGSAPIVYKDSLLEHTAATSSTLFSGNFSLLRNRMYISGFLALNDAASLAMTMTDNLFVTHHGTSSTSQNGLIRPGGSASSGSPYAHVLTHNAFIELDSTSTCRTAVSIDNASAGSLGQYYTIQMNGNLFNANWIKNVDVAAGAGPRIAAGDLNEFAPGNSFSIGNSTNMPLTAGGGADWQGGWFATWVTTDPNSLSDTATFNSYSAPHAWADRNPYVEAAGSPGISIASGPRVSTFAGAAWATQPGYTDMLDALWGAGVFA